ncbi:MAG TPA: MFS transporter [Cytophagaceae bacterium]|jgi:UMF1 family MFS transporter|nr:MFS transporter [Cytophagaceae bacterium]
MEKNNPKVLNGWCMYDWANSVFSLTITTAVFPEYFLSATTAADGNSIVDFWGYPITNSVLYSYGVSFSFLIAAILSPISTSIADVAGRKKFFMSLFAYMGSAACALLYFFHSPADGGVANVDWVIPTFVLASLGYSGSIVYYNSFLPDIATEDRFDGLSAKGFSLGYIGSVLLLIINIAMILGADTLGITSGEAARISFLTVGLWWFVFATYSFSQLPSDQPVVLKGWKWLSKGFQELKDIGQKIGTRKLLKRFLISFFFYNMGVQTVMYLAPLFAKEVIHIESAELIATILIIQLVAILGAYCFNLVSSRLGNTRALAYGIVIWLLICASGYFVQKGISFFCLAGTIGFVMGGIQSLSRATYSKLLPEGVENTASFFSFYDVTEKISIVLGTFLFGFIRHITGDMRNTLLMLGLLFITGLIIILTIPSKKVYVDSQ